MYTHTCTHTHRHTLTFSRAHMHTRTHTTHTLQYESGDIILCHCPVPCFIVDVCKWVTCVMCYDLGLGTGTDNRTGIFTGISPQSWYFAPVYRSTQCCSDLLSHSSYINGHSQEFDFYARLEGSLLRCQGHIGRSDRQRLRVLSVFLFLKPKCLHMLALPLSFLTTINPSSSRAAIFVRERETERVLPLEWVPVYRCT